MNNPAISHYVAARSRFPHIRPVSAMMQRQQGFSLLIGLIFLVVLTLLGLSGATLTNLDEHMARNTRDRVLAFQAAEAAIRDAHDDINNVMHSANRLILNTGQTFAGANCATNNDYLGVCTPAASGQTVQVWDQYLDTGNAPPSIVYLSLTDPTHATHKPFVTTPGVGGSVAAPPRYLIEVLNYSSPNSSMSARNGITFVYRITSVGYGADIGTRVVLQEVYKPV